MPVYFFGVAHFFLCPITWVTKGQVPRQPIRLGAVHFAKRVSSHGSDTSALTLGYTSTRTQKYINYSFGQINKDFCLFWPIMRIIKKQGSSRWVLGNLLVCMYRLHVGRERVHPCVRGVLVCSSLYRHAQVGLLSGCSTCQVKGWVEQGPKEGQNVSNACGFYERQLHGRQ